MAFKTAFTLAEVLVTLAVVGIIAAMSIPALISSTSDKELIVAAKKEYSVIQSALTMYKADNGGSLAGMFPVSGDSNYSMNELSKYLRISKKCTTSEDCWSESTKNLNKQGDIYGYMDYASLNLSHHNASAVLVDGSRIVVRNFADKIGVPQYCTSYNTDGTMMIDGDGNPVTHNCEYDNYAYIYFDVNGARGPNSFGKDTWELQIYDDKIKACRTGTYRGCLEKILQNDQLVAPKEN